MTEQKPEEKLEQKPKKEKKLPVNFMVDEFMDQQLITLNKGGKKDATNADGSNGSTN